MTDERKLKVIVTGAGGSAAIGFCRSLKMSGTQYELIGLDSDKYHLCLAETDKKYLVPKANDPDYLPIINYISEKHKADFLHSQPDPEIEYISEIREQLAVKTNLPRKDVVKTCLNKFKSFEIWEKYGIKVPGTMMIRNKSDLELAFHRFGPKIWIRNFQGAAGKGSLPTCDIDEAVSWINFCGGWEEFTASEYLSDKTITWQSIWHKGQLIVAQARQREYWEFGNRSPSGVTGLTGTGITVSDEVVDKIAQKAITSIDSEPNGIYGVDMTYDGVGVPNPTEINIGRFFTTHYFFTKAGVNFPDIYVKLSLGEQVELPEKKLSPLEVNLAWVRGLDSVPVLTKKDVIEENVKKLAELRLKVK